jgi:hypothetical protein
VVGAGCYRPPPGAPHPPRAPTQPPAGRPPPRTLPRSWLRFLRAAASDRARASPRAARTSSSTPASYLPLRPGPPPTQAHRLWCGCFSDAPCRLARCSGYGAPRLRLLRSEPPPNAREVGSRSSRREADQRHFFLNCQVRAGDCWVGINVSVSSDQDSITLSAEASRQRLKKKCPWSPGLLGECQPGRLQWSREEGS